MTRPKTFLIFLIVSSLSPLLAGKIEKGKPFPDLRLPSLQDGRPMSVTDFRGEKLILHIWASW